MSEKEYIIELFKALGHEPTAAQWPIHLDQYRFKLIAGGERGGKSETGSKETTKETAPLVDGLVWIVASTYDIPRNTEFMYVADDLKKLGILADGNLHRPENGPCNRLTELRTRIVTRSTQDPERLGMEAPDFILVCEAAQIPYEAFLRLLGRCSQKKAKMVLTGTFEQKNDSKWYEEYFNMWLGKNNDDAKSYSLPSWTNTKIYTPGEHSITLKNGQVIKNVPDEIYRLYNQTPIDIFMERYAGLPVKSVLAVLPEFTPTIHVGDFPFNPDLPVELAIDPGYAAPGAHAVVAIQVFNGRVYLIDELYKQRATTEDMIIACRQKIWWGKVKGGSIDFAGRGHAANKSPLEIWQAPTKDGGAGLYLDSKQVAVEDGVEVLRTFLKPNPLENNQPMLYVDAKCKGFIAEAGGGKSPIPGGSMWKRNEVTNKVRDDNCHSTKAVIYWLVNRFGFVPRISDNSVQRQSFY
jgi:hypothetical protein